MTGSWTIDCFIVGCVVLLAVPAMTAVVNEAKGKGEIKND